MIAALLGLRWCTVELSSNDVGLDCDEITTATTTDHHLKMETFSVSMLTVFAEHDSG